MECSGKLFNLNNRKFTPNHFLMISRIDLSKSRFSLLSKSVLVCCGNPVVVCCGNPILVCCGNPVVVCCRNPVLVCCGNLVLVCCGNPVLVCCSNLKNSYCYLSFFVCFCRVISIKNFCSKIRVVIQLLQYHNKVV